MLIIFGGLPATGKTTIAQALAKHIKATYLRVDTIEHSIALTGKVSADMEDMGYRIGYSLATENLKLGNSVIADSVNPLDLTRAAWRNAAKLAASEYLEVEIICSDKTIHQQHAENRLTDIPNFTLPTWQKITDRYYQPWLNKPLTIDTATTSVAQAVDLILQYLSK
ncbi:AAA family ATPase [Entomomonas asaccharolytica]|uniref:AAA family ATPase n=1 Tax=Entomomonas asaccharolytica TaxID=2785331 RepID=A0A974NDU2_9GAMM|nr:AAA family ATPase [Entomomonas asaccharolytica]QQP84612.1 AAA family ATPase [Entomomonas asaccharolytica]